MNKRQRKKRDKKLKYWKEILGKTTYALWQPTDPSKTEYASFTMKQAQEAIDALNARITKNIHEMGTPRFSI